MTEERNTLHLGRIEHKTIGARLEHVTARWLIYLLCKQSEQYQVTSSKLNQV